MDKWLNLSKLLSKFKHLPIFALLLVPVILLAVFVLTSEYRNLTKSILSEQELVVRLSVNSLENQFTQALGVGILLAGREDFKSAISRENWDEAIKLLEGTPSDFLFIERIFLTDAKGVLMADTPSLPGVRGKSFSFRDWYLGVSEKWEPYISEIYKRTAEPQYNVVAIAIPIKLDFKVVGIMVIQVRLDVFIDWTKRINLAESSFVYFVDQRGHVVGHPDYPPQGEIGDFSSSEIVKKIRQGEHGVGVFRDLKNESSLVAYSPIEKYGWGVIYSQDKATAFTTRDRAVYLGIIFYGIFILYSFFLSYLISRLQLNLRQYLTGLEDKVKERTGDIAREKSRYEAMLSSIGDGVVVVDTNARIVRINSAASKMLGCKEGDAIGKRAFDEVLVEDEFGNPVSENNRPVNRALLEGITTTNATHFHTRKDGTKFLASITVTPVVLEGKIIGAIEVFRDVTKEKELDQAKSEFISIASHQLRTPVSGLSWLVEALEFNSKGFNLQQKRCVKDLSVLSKRLVGLIEDLLNFSKIELRTAVAVEKTEVEISDFVEEFIKEIESYAILKKHTLLFNRGSGGQVIVEINKKSLYNALQNLITNAIDYSPENTPVTVSLEKIGQSIKISITNKGPAIPKDDQPHIFERFYRAESTKKIKPEGTGLGLYIVKAIIEEVGGRAGFESEEGQDTVFWVTIPIKKTNQN